jgi:hypothetical protein
VRETWLHTNRRAIIFGCVPPLAIVAIGAWLTLRIGSQGDHPWRWLGIILTLLGAGTIATLIRQLLRPRIAFQNGQVLFYLRSGPPITVPVDIVEAFFAGQGPAHLPAMTKQPQNVNLIARLSQRHTEWASKTVKPALGNWSDGYVTIRGSWCEPLDGEVIRKLNRRLKEEKDAT